MAGRKLAARDRRVLTAVAKQAAGLVRQRELTAEASQAEAIAQADELRRSLLSAVSHDLRTPLAAAKAAVSSLRADDVGFSPEDTAELLATVEESVDQLTALVGNLLDSSRLAAGVVQPDMRPRLPRGGGAAGAGQYQQGRHRFRRAGAGPGQGGGRRRRGVADAGSARTGAGQPDRQRAALRPGQRRAGQRRAGRRPGTDRRGRRGPGHPARGRGAAVRAVPARSATATTPPAWAWAFRWPADSSRRWAAPSRRPTPPAAG